MKTKYTLFALFLLIALLLAGTNDYNEAKEAATQWKANK